MSVRALRRLSILVDVEDVASARLAAINGAASKASNSMDSTGNSAARASANIKGLAIAASIGAVALHRISRTGIEVDRTFATIEETMGATEREMDAIRSQAEQLGQELPVKINEVADAMKQLAFSGMDASEAVKASTAVTELAIASQMDMQQAAKMVTQQMNAFNIEADNVGQITDSLASVFADSAIELQTLGSSMEYVSATASGLGFSFTETAAAIGTLSDNALEGSRAGTALNQALNSLMGQSEGVRKALAGAGLSMEDFTDENGELMSLVDIVGVLHDRMEEIDPEDHQLQRWLVDTFGQRGARAMQPLLENFEDFEKKVREGARAELMGTHQNLEDLDDVEIAEKELILAGDDPEEVREQIEEMSDEEILEAAEDVDIDFTEDPVETLRHLREEFERGEIAEEEIAKKLEEAYGFEAQVAEQLADDITNLEKSIDDVGESWEETVTNQDIARAQMEEVGGKLDDLRGSFQAAAYIMYQGFHPALSTILDGLIYLVDRIESNEKVLKVLGMALFSVTSVLTILTAKAVATAAALWIQNTALWANVTAALTLQGAMGPLLPLALAATAAFYAYQTNLYGFADAVDRVIDGLKWLYEATDETIGVVNALLIALGPIGWALLIIRHHFGSFAEAAEYAKTVVDDTIETVTDLGESLGITSERVSSAVDWLQDLTNWSRVAGYAVAFLAAMIGVKLTFATVGLILSLGKAVKALYALQVLLGGGGGLIATIGALGAKVAFVAKEIYSIGVIAGRFLLPIIGSAIKVVGKFAAILGLKLAKGAAVGAIALGKLAVAFWPITLAVLAGLTVIIAYRRNWLGFADAVDYVVGKLAGLYDWIKSTIGIANLAAGAVVVLAATVGKGLTAALGAAAVAAAALAIKLWPITLAVAAGAAAIYAYRNNLYGFADGVDYVVDGLSTLVGKITDSELAFRFLKGMVMALAAPLLAVRDLYLATTGAIDDVNDEIDDLTGYVEDLLDPLETLEEYLGKVHDWLKDISSLNISLRDIISEFGLIESVVDKIEGAAETISEWLESLENFNPDFSEARDAITDLFGPLNTLLGKIESAADGLAGLGSVDEEDLPDVSDEERVPDADQDTSGTREDRARDRSDLDEDDDTSTRGLSLETPDPQMAFGPGVALADEFSRGIRDGQPAITRAMDDSMRRAAAFLPSSDAERGPLSNIFYRGQQFVRTFADGILSEAQTLQRAANQISSILSQGMQAPSIGGDGSAGGLMSKDPWGPMGAFGASGLPIGDPRAAGSGGMGGMGGVGQAAMAQANRQQNFVGGDGGMMLDNRHINMQQAPNIDITASQEDVDRGAISNEIEQAMDRSQDKAVNRMIDLFKMSTGSTPEGDTGSTPSTDTEEGEGEEEEGLTEDDFSEDELPEDWDEWSEEEQQEWLDEQEEQQDDEEADLPDELPEDWEEMSPEEQDEWLEENDPDLPDDDEEDTTDDEEDTTDGDEE